MIQIKVRVGGLAELKQPGGQKLAPVHILSLPPSRRPTRLSCLTCRGECCRLDRKALSPSSSSDLWSRHRFLRLGQRSARPAGWRECALQRQAVLLGSQCSCAASCARAMHVCLVWDAAQRTEHEQQLLRAQENAESARRKKGRGTSQSSNTRTPCRPREPSTPTGSQEWSL